MRYRMRPLRCWDVPTSQVEITSVYLGSTYVDIVITYPSRSLSEGRSEQDFAALVMAEGGIARVFQNSSHLGEYEVWVANFSTVLLNDAGNTITWHIISSEEPVASTGPAAAPRDPECAPAAPGCQAAAPLARCADGANGGCDPRAQCVDAEGGRTCGACPPGFYGDGATRCLDVDECAVPAPCDPLTECQNSEGGFACSPCPPGFRGSGATACREVTVDTSCAEHNGGCDPLVQCTELTLQHGGGTSCGVCPEGYVGSGDSACLDFDACVPEPCFAGVDCEDVPAPGFGYACGSCPPGLVGDGERCFEDVCATSAPCDPLVTCASREGGHTCGPCPAGYLAQGAACLDIDECAGAARGACDPHVRCVNQPGGFKCGKCPEGMLGSGYTRCLQASPCGVDNGGCDPLTTCSNARGGAPECGACPIGYAGTGAAGCVDEDGCAAAGAVGACFGSCLDVQAPGTGYACAPCPPEMVGGGRTCAPNLCYIANGGCDAGVTCIMDAAAGTRECGACPAGTAPVPDFSLSSGFRCAEADGCRLEPCWQQGSFTQSCMDIPAPGTGRTCGACPAGFMAAEEGAGCVDVDECVLSANGGCWVSAAAATIRARCTNAPGGRLCGSCPAGYIGTGETECRKLSLCNDNNGGCDPLTACSVASAGAGGVSCGPCPAGHSGTGATACVDVDGCALEPCFPGVACADVAAPGEGRTCGSCPEAVDGVMKASAINQLAGSFDGMSSENCVVTQGVAYWWEAVASDGAAVLLDSAVNMRETLTLHLPRHTLAANRAYSVRLTATLRGNTRVRAAADTSFVVEWQALVAVIRGGAVTTGEGLPVLLDAGESFDPDSLPEEMTFRWSCVRVDASGAERNCRMRSGALLPTQMTSTRLNLTMRGDTPGAEYVWECQVAKGDRWALVTTWMTVSKEPVPVAAIVPLGRKHIPSEILRLRSQVTSTRPETVSMKWTVAAGEGTPDLDIGVAARIVLDLPDLVIAPHSLQPGGMYWFALRIQDSYGPASCIMEVQVNQPPYAGGLTVHPLRGTMSETVFDVQSFGWQDDPADLPLWYQLRYDILGAEAGTIWWTAWQPSPVFAEQMTSAGLEEHGHAVAVRLLARDAYGAFGEVATNLTVYPLVFASEAARLLHVDIAIENASQQVLQYGIDTSPTVASIASIFNDLDGLSSGLKLEDNATLMGLNASSSRRQGQRHKMMGVLHEVWERLPSTTDTVTRMAQNAAKVASKPAELNRDSRGEFQTLAMSLVAATMGSGEERWLDQEGAAALLHGLSSVTVSGMGTANQSEVVGTSVEVVRRIGLSNMQAMVPEEDPVAISTTVHSSLSMRLDLGSNRSRAYVAPVETPGGGALQMQSSLAAALGEHCDLSAVDLLVTSSAVDPHAAAGSAREVDVAVSNMTSVSLHESDRGAELPVSGLEEALTILLPICLPANLTSQVLPDDDDPRSKARRRRDAAAARAAEMVAPFAGAECRFWDEARGAYGAEGCATLPNPRPPNTSVYWRTRNVFALGRLAEAWDVVDERVAANLSFTAGCEEVWGAAYPEYRGEDAGWRKYVGEPCRLVDKGNEAGCWWEWRVAAFQGPGCVWVEETSCLCTHLTDFASVQQAELGSISDPPVPPEVYSSGDMTGVTWAEVLSSTALLAVLAVLVLGTPLLYTVSNEIHYRERIHVLQQLVDVQEGSVFRQIDGMWTWTIVNPGSYIGALASKHNDRHKALMKVSAISQCLTGVMREQKLRKGRVANKFLKKWRKAPNGGEDNNSSQVTFGGLVAMLRGPRAPPQAVGQHQLGSQSLNLNRVSINTDALSVHLKAPEPALLEMKVFKKLRLAAREKRQAKLRSVFIASGATERFRQPLRASRDKAAADQSNHAIGAPLTNQTMPLARRTEDVWAAGSQHALLTGPPAGYPDQIAVDRLAPPPHPPPPSLLAGSL
ncbi:hypothetical protein CYMTET_51442 [Cymbomonas tetramitiformis]|uniref:EGF-like domain-containing protein n=1 Tax=Cymbomonas tetramitiformis TaxID=36881 RepID=A0AAE0BM77_9CHLO|nr:hypothetical protein CYMTET_51442 [Cymbomonas tetramitiformis]